MLPARRKSVRPRWWFHSMMCLAATFVLLYIAFTWRLLHELKSTQLELSQQAYVGVAEPISKISTATVAEVDDITPAVSAPNAEKPTPTEPEVIINLSTSSFPAPSDIDLFRETWTKNVFEVFPGIFIAARFIVESPFSVRQFQAHRVTMVVNLDEADLSHDQITPMEDVGIDYVHLPISSNPPSDFNYVEKRAIRIARDIRQAQANNEAILLHCTVGFARSVAVVAVWRMIQNSIGCLTNQNGCRTDNWEQIVQNIHQVISASNGTTTPLTHELSRRLIDAERHFQQDPHWADGLMKIKEDALHEVYPKLFITSLGGVRHHAAQLRNQHRVGLVINLCDEEHQLSTLHHFKTDGIEYLFQPTIEAGSTDIIRSRALPLAAKIRATHARDESAIVHCCAGVNRSVTVGIVWKMLEAIRSCAAEKQSNSCPVEGWESILKHMHNTRSIVGPMREFCAQMGAFEQLLRTKNAVSLQSEYFN